MSDFLSWEIMSLLRAVGDAIASTVNLVYTGSGPSFIARNLDFIRENKEFYSVRRPRWILRVC